MMLLTPIQIAQPATERQDVSITASRDWRPDARIVTPIYALSPREQAAALAQRQAKAAALAKAQAQAKAIAAAAAAAAAKAPVLAKAQTNAKAVNRAAASVHGQVKQGPLMAVRTLPQHGALMVTVHFKTASAKVAPRFWPALAHLPHRHCYLVVGHTDPRGSAHYNLNLSAARAGRVAFKIRAQGIQTAIQADGKYGMPTGQKHWPADRRVNVYTQVCR